MAAVKFDCELVKISSRPDKTYDIVLNVPEYHLEQVTMIMGWVHDAVAVAMVDLDGENSNVNVLSWSNDAPK